jgi:YfiH family protein
VSAPPYDSCNVGHHVGDAPAAVAQNRSRVAAGAGLPPPAEWAWLHQVHGAQVVTTERPTAAHTPAADAAATATRGLPIAVVSADCAPVVVANDSAFGVVHAGHRGLVAGVVEGTVARVRELGAGPVRAFLGPCIRVECYEFGTEDLAVLTERFGAAVEGRTRAGTPALDLAAAVRVALGAAGVDHLDDCGVCTADDPDMFSYRRDGTPGRQATVAVLT